MRINIIIFALAATLCGCMSNPHADAGKRFSTEGKMEQALPELEQAAREEPKDFEVRAALERTRSLLANRYCIEGENARVGAHYDAAEAAFLRAVQRMATEIVNAMEEKW